MAELNRNFGNKKNMQLEIFCRKRQNSKRRNFKPLLVFFHQRKQVGKAANREMKDRIRTV